MADNKTSIQLPIPLNERIKRLAEKWAKDHKTSKVPAQWAYLETLVTEEEERQSAQ